MRAGTLWARKNGEGERIKWRPVTFFEKLRFRSRHEADKTTFSKSSTRVCVTCYGFGTVFTGFVITNCEGRRKNETGLPVDGSSQYEQHSTRNVMTTWSLSRKPAEYMLLGASCWNIFIYNSKLTVPLLCFQYLVMCWPSWPGAGNHCWCCIVGYHGHGFFLYLPDPIWRWRHLSRAHCDCLRKT